MNDTLSNYPAFRAEAMGLKSNIGTMISKMDGVMASGKFTDARKSEILVQLSDEYMS